MTQQSESLATAIKAAIYLHFAETGRSPTVDEIAQRVACDTESVLSGYRRLAKQRALVIDDRALEGDGVSIRMAMPFSGVPTQHIVESEGIRYYANCGWDALGIPAALGKSARVRSRCEQTGEALDLAVGLDGPEPSDWLFHSLVPAARWWDDIVST